MKYYVPCDALREKPMTLPSKTDATPPASPSRRIFCCTASALLLARGGLLRAAVLAAQVQPGPPATATRPDVAAIDHDRILAAATRYLTQPPTPLTSLQCARSPGSPHDYYSEAEPAALAEGESNAGPSAPAGSGSRAGPSSTALAGPSTKPGAPSATPPPFTAHRDALFALGLAVPALAAAHLLTGDQRYAEHAALWLRAWFVDPATRMTPRLDYGQIAPGQPADGRFEGILETLPLVEVAQAIPFLASALSPSDRLALHAWFAAYLRWLTEAQDSGPRLPALARDRKDHHGTSWLLQASAYALLTAPDGDAPRSETSALDELRHRFRTVTLRAQIAADGSFPHELTRSALPRLALQPGHDGRHLPTALHPLRERLGVLNWTTARECARPSPSTFPSSRTAPCGPSAPTPSTSTSSPRGAPACSSPPAPTSARSTPRYGRRCRRTPPRPTSCARCRIHQPLLWVRQPPRAA